MYTDKGFFDIPSWLEKLDKTMRLQHESKHRNGTTKAHDWHQALRRSRKAQRQARRAHRFG